MEKPNHRTNRRSFRWPGAARAMVRTYLSGTESQDSPSGLNALTHKNAAVLQAASRPDCGAKTLGHSSVRSRRSIMRSGTRHSRTILDVDLARAWKNKDRTPLEAGERKRIRSSLRVWGLRRKLCRSAVRPGPGVEICKDRAGTHGLPRLRPLGKNSRYAAHLLFRAPCTFMGEAFASRASVSALIIFITFQGLFPVPLARPE